MNGAIEPSPTVVATLTETAPGVRTVLVNIEGTNDLVLVVNMLARARVSVLEKIQELGREQARANEARIMRPNLKLVLPGGC